MQKINHRNNKTALVIAGCLLSSALVASQVPATLAFEEGEQFNLSLSRTNFNRVFVEGEKITQLNFPEGSFTIDKSEIESSNSNEGSVYVKPVLDTQLTIFFTTDKGHHFSLTVQPNESTGKTVRLLVKNQTTTRYVKRDINSSDAVESAMHAMQLGEIPKDFKLAHIKAQPFYVKHDVKVTLEKHYLSPQLAGYVYKLENKSAHPIALTTSLFNKHQAASLMLSADTLEPKQVAYLYGLYHAEG